MLVLLFNLIHHRLDVFKQSEHAEIVPVRIHNVRISNQYLGKQVRDLYVLQFLHIFLLAKCATRRPQKAKFTPELSEPDMLYSYAVAMPMACAGKAQTASQARLREAMEFNFLQHGGARF